MWITRALKVLAKESIFPSACVGCGKPGKNICKKCENSLQKIDFPLCLVCDQLCINGITHKACKSHDTPNQLTSPFKYNGLAREIIIKSKHGPKSYKLLDTLLKHQHNIEHLKSISKSIDIIVPIPMTKKFYSSRLINHSKYISEFVSEKTSKQIANILNKSTIDYQKAYSRTERLDNIYGKITITGTRNIKNKKILLVDDVTTTGATLIEATRALKKAEVKDVFCYTLAKD